MADGTDLEAKNIEEIVANKILEEIQEEIKRSGKIDPGLASDIVRYDPEAGGTGNQNRLARSRVKGDEQDPQEDARAKWRRRGILDAATFAAGPARGLDGSECRAAASRQKFIKTCKVRRPPPFPYSGF